MAGAWIFFTAFIALFITAMAQNDPEKCIKSTCGPGEACNRQKCDDNDGYCIRKEDCNNVTVCPGGCVKKGKHNWCKHYKKCKCCMPDICDPPCNTKHGMCMHRKCKCDPGWRDETCDQFYCDPECHPDNGVCTGPNTCTCASGWCGSTCEQFCCNNPACVHGNCTGPNNCNCDIGWCGPACNDSCCQDQPCQNGGTCVGTNKDPNECDCPEGFTGPTCEFPPVICSNARKCNNVNGTCYYKTNPILQNPTFCPNTIGGKRWCDPRGDCVCCYE